MTKTFQTAVQVPYSPPDTPYYQTDVDCIITNDPERMDKGDYNDKMAGYFWVYSWYKVHGQPYYFKFRTVNEMIEDEKFIHSLLTQQLTPEIKKVL